MIVLLLLLLGLAAFAVAILRILNASARPPWQPDSSLGLYALALIASIILGLLSDAVMGGRDSLVAGLAIGALAAILRAPLAPWFVAMAVERPLALQPAPFMRRFASWLPALLLWSLLIVVPLAQLHDVLSRMLITGAGRLVLAGRPVRRPAQPRSIALLALGARLGRLQARCAILAVSAIARRIPVKRRRSAMAGHSKFKNIMYRKGAQDKKRSAMFSKLSPRDHRRGQDGHCPIRT